MASSLQIQCLFSLSFVLALLANQATSRHLLKPQLSMSARHEQWMARHGRVYENAEEQQKRYKIFKNNVKMIESFNAAGEKPFNVSVNKFADLSHEEFKNMYLGMKPSRHPSSNVTVTSLNNEGMINVPTSLDWRSRGVVTPVKSQGSNCGSCWAFAALSAVEAMHLLKYGNYHDLSEQQLMDCDHTSNACDGGDMRDAFDYIIANGGVTEEANYPYVGYQQYCNTVKEAQPTVRLSSYQKVQPYSEAYLMSAVNLQPVTVGIDAGNRLFQYYHGGIFTAKYCRPDVLNHGVLLVGYDTAPDGTNYWIIKNSWGENWGENGYMRIARDDNAGICGITSYGTLLSV